MTAAVLHDPVSLAYTSSDGVRRHGMMPAAACPALTRDLLAGLVDLIHPHGRLTMRSAIDKYLISARRLVLFMDGRDFTGGAGDLTRTDLVEFWLASQHLDEPSRSISTERGGSASS
ncbi:hypothetical protein AB0B67_46315, partial [Streptomyces spectabilis]